MANLFRTRSFLTGVFLFAAAVCLGFVVHYFQKPDTTVFEGTYPGVRGLIEPKFAFTGDEIILTLPEPVSTKQLVVFVYDEHGSQFGMLKDVRAGAIRIGKNDYPEYEAVFRGEDVEGYRIFRRVSGKPDVTDFLTLMHRARDAHLRYGVQQCMYPVCTRCLNVCPVISKGVIEMRQAENGAIVPFVMYGGCPRSGKCFGVCTLGAFYKADMRHVQVNPQNTVKLKTVLQPEILQ